MLNPTRARLHLMPLDPLVPRVVGQVFFRPWWDALGVPLVAGVYFPLSRAWAAATAAGGDARALGHMLDIARPGAVLLRRAHGVGRLARLYGRAEALWRDAFFTSGVNAGELAAVARRRDRAAFRFMIARRSFLPWLRQVPPVRWDVATPDDVWARHGERARGQQPAYPAPAYPDIEVSGVLATARTRQYWLRFPSPVLGDTAWAHVYEPASAPAKTTMIFLHGIAVDGDMWPEAGDTFSGLLERGIRIVRPTGPWHGRRMLHGFYGGEPIIGRGLLGMLDAFQAALAEVAVLTRWAREAGSRTVVLSGVSLGSLTAQVTATACRAWPPEMQADVLFLIATSGSMTDVAFGGSLAKSLGIPQRLADAGWTSEALEPWLALLEPHDPAVMAPERIVMVLGEADDLTPFAGGSALARRWQVPAENLFLRPQGHFSVALGLLCDPAPIDRLLAIIDRAAG